METTSDSSDSAPSSARVYSVLPRAVLADASLSDAAVRLYGLLDSRQTSASRVRVTRALLAADTGWSLSKVVRVLDELRDAGWLRSHRTGRSSSYSVLNPAREQQTRRTAEQLLTSVSANRTNTPSALDQLLTADRRGLLDCTTRASHAALRGAQERGWHLDEIADVLNSVLLTNAQSPGGLLFHRLRSLADEASPVERATREEALRERERLVLSGALTCQHGEPRGPEACALCRIAAADVAVGIAAALEPTGKPADVAAREALADLVTAADPDPWESLLEGLGADLAVDRHATRSETA